MPLTGHPSSWSSSSRIAAIYRAIGVYGDDANRHVKGTFRASAGPSLRGRHKCPICRSVQQYLMDRLGVEPFVYRTNSGEPVGYVERTRRLRNEIAEVHAHLIDTNVIPGDSDATPMPSDASESSSDASSSDVPPTASDAAQTAEDDHEAATSDPAPVRPSDPAVGEQLRRFRDKLEHARRFADERGAESPSARALTLNSMRAAIDGTRLILKGIPVDAVMSMILCDWPADTRAQLALWTWNRQVVKAPDAGDYDYASWGTRPNRFTHAAAAMAVAIGETGVPLYLYGPAGTGKSTLARALADSMAVDYYEVNLSGAMPSTLKGKDRPSGDFLITEFLKAYENGGVLCVEEVDFSDPRVLGLTHNAIANTEFRNDADGKVYVRHPDFRIVCTANTLGNGSEAGFKRTAIDGAFKDRVRLGRIFVGLDRELENAIVNQIVADHAAV